MIKNKIINIDEPISNENLLKLNMLLNTTLNGMSIEEINLGLIARLKEQAGIHSQVVGYVLDAVAEAIHVDDDMHLYIRLMIRSILRSTQAVRRTLSNIRS